jgi:hypothetical protein
MFSMAWARRKPLFFQQPILLCEHIHPLAFLYSWSFISYNGNLLKIFDLKAGEP